MIKDNDWKMPEALYQISKVCVNDFKNFELARTCIKEIQDKDYKAEAISNLVMASEDLNDFDLVQKMLSEVKLNDLFLELTKKMILQKKFDEVQQLDQLFYTPTIT
jgi:hypothetical protein